MERKEMNDPKYTPITVNLESIPGKSFAVTKAYNGSYVLWYYDPRNRIMTPRVTTFPCLEELLAELAIFLIDTHEDDPKIKTTMEKAAQWAELCRLEYKAKAYETGGYSTSDPTEVDGLGSPTSRILTNKVKAEEMAKAAKQLRWNLENKPKEII